ncbi:MAG TPA: TetR/AcrR family transcriptional regulator [Streptosporangiaceae bacterium]|nr:TetR/AcrR family transcriptional regulator [Streptosporangiaceae bacterium]
MSETIERAAGAARPPGRPRSERADKAIIDATLALLLEEGGVAGVTIEAVAARAGVGKTTIYRRWPNKEALIIDALASLKEPDPELAGVSVRDDLVALTRTLGVEKRDRQRVGVFWSVFGHGDRHPELHGRFTRDVVEPRRERMRAVLRRGIETGELRPDIDIDLVMWLLMGAIVHRARAYGVGPAPDDFAEQIVDTALRGLTPR